jgi:membrane protease YdiL (CAAX protease family)
MLKNEIRATDNSAACAKPEQLASWAHLAGFLRLGPRGGFGTSITAGVCEEMVFRGCVQRQLHALSGSVVAAVLGQGLVFGLFHSYQGWTNVIVISVLGVLYGAGICEPT